MPDTSVTLDPKSLSKVLSRLQSIDKNLTPTPRTPLSDVLNITGLDIAREAKKASPVDTGRLRSSIHVKSKPTETFLYNDKNGEVHSGTLKEPIEAGKEVVVGTNVAYARKQNEKHDFMGKGLRMAEPAMRRRLQQLAEKVVNGKPNISIS